MHDEMERARTRLLADQLLYQVGLQQQELAKQVDNILANDALQCKMIEKGYTYAKKFADDKLAAQLEKIYILSFLWKS